ncbi:MAG: Multidrug resistance protein stp [Pelotomaculum sp. PtaU1.Bin035]|nr:MAG: Multidrug resistance protein stp [Pelotomaculum sp. PtaU1.Bin035]
MATLAVGTFMAPLDSSVVNIVLPQISRYFQSDLASVEWVIMSYLLVISSLLLIYGRLGDMYGHKEVYVTGFIIFTLASVLCGVAQSLPALIAFRVVQALGAGMMMAIGPAIIAATFPPGERGRALGLIGSTVAAALAFGPTIGGILSDYLGWRSVFYINLPIGIAAITASVIVLQRSVATKQQNFDFAGAGAAFLGLFFLLFALSRGQSWGWQSAGIMALLMGALVLLAAFIFVEKRVKEPMMDLTLFRNRLFTMANLTSLLNFMAQFSVVFLMPFYLERVRQLDPSTAGMLLSAGPLVILFVAPVSGYLSDRMGSRLLSSLGMGIIAAALFSLSGLGVETPYPYIALSLGAMGLGVGLFQAPNNNAVISSVPRHRLGIASGMMASMRNIGMVLGVAISGAVFQTMLPIRAASLQSQNMSGTALESLAFVDALRYSYWVAIILAVLGIFTSLVRGGSFTKAEDMRE